VTDFCRGRFVLRSLSVDGPSAGRTGAKRPILCRYWPMAAISMEIRPGRTVSDRVRSLVGITQTRRERAQASSARRPTFRGISKAKVDQYRGYHDQSNGTDQPRDQSSVQRGDV